MSGILDFFVNNYILFIVLSLIMIFALIGYFVNTKQDERFIKKIEIDKELEARMNVAQATNMTINQMVQANDTVVDTAGLPQTPMNDEKTDLPNTEGITDIENSSN